MFFYLCLADEVTLMIAVLASLVDLYLLLSALHVYNLVCASSTNECLSVLWGFATCYKLLISAFIYNQLVIVVVVLEYFK